MLSRPRALFFQSSHTVECQRSIYLPSAIHELAEKDHAEVREPCTEHAWVVALIWKGNRVEPQLSIYTIIPRSTYLVRPAPPSARAAQSQKSGKPIWSQWGSYWISNCHGILSRSRAGKWVPWEYQKPAKIWTYDPSASPHWLAHPPDCLEHNMLWRL